MTTIAPTCEIAAKLSTIEHRLREKSRLATSEFAVMGYAQASLEIAREGLEHYRNCDACRSFEAQNAPDRRAA